MTELCFAQFARCFQKFLQPPNDDVNTVELLLGWITFLPDVKDKKDETIYFAPSTISDLLNRKINVHSSIKKACSSNEILTMAEEHCKTQILGRLNPFTKEDMFKEMLNAIQLDVVIADSTKKELTDLLEKEEKAKFLGLLLIYTISRENRIRNCSIEQDDIPLLSEANYECPICHTPLVGYIKNTAVKKYDVIHIYPANASAINTEFAAFAKPKYIDSPTNKIVLCRDHAEEYKLEPTIEEYTNLKSIKSKIANAYSLRAELNGTVLEEKIQNILYGLAEITEDTVLEELPLTALRLDQKILPQNRLLKNDEKMRVLRYYNYISELFSSLERERDIDFKLIASEIKVAYNKLDNGQLSQYEIVDLLADWIKSKSRVGNEYSLACKIVVAFFIQNCEVFREISK